MAKVIAMTNFMDLNIFSGETYDLTEDKIKSLGEHNFHRVTEGIEIEITPSKPEPAKTGEEVHKEHADELSRIENAVKEDKVMKTKDIKKK